MSGKRRKRVKPGRPAAEARSGAKGPSRALFVGVIVVAVAVLGYLLFAQPYTAGPITIGSAAPDFTLPIITEEGLMSDRITLSSFRGKVVFLEFMVSWCTYCQQMAPVILRLYEAYRGEDVVFISIAGTFGGASAESTSKFIQDYGARWVHVLDSSNTVFQRYGVSGTPTYFVINRDGTVHSRMDGRTPYELLAFRIAQALVGKQIGE